MFIHELSLGQVILWVTAAAIIGFLPAIIHTVRKTNRTASVVPVLSIFLCVSYGPLPPIIAVTVFTILALVIKPIEADATKDE